MEHTSKARVFPKNAAEWMVRSAALLIVIIVLAGPSAAPHNPLHANLSQRLAPPSFTYPLGNDGLGRCILSRILSGAKTSVGLGIIIVSISCFTGVAVGLVSGYAGGLLDEMMMRITDVFFSFPELVAAMAVVGIMGSGTMHLISAVCMVSWMRYARMVRGITLSVKENNYIKSAKLSGVSRSGILVRHILPASIPSVIALAAVGLGKAVLAVSALGFLGFGVQPPTPEWGMMLMEGKNYLISAPHLSVAPGLAVMITVLTFNLLGNQIPVGNQRV